LSLQSGKGTNFCLSCLWPKRGEKSMRCLRCSVIIKNTGRHVSAVARERMSMAAHNRPPISEETRAKKRSVMVGRLFSKETRIKLSLAAKKRYENPEERRLAIEYNRLHCRTPEFRKQASATARSRWQDPVVIEKHSGPNCHLWRGGIAKDSRGPEFTRFAG
jgi:hypothetical protein